MELKLTKTRLQDLGIVRHQLVPKKYDGKEVTFEEAVKAAEGVAKKLGYKLVTYYQESKKSYEFRLTGRDKKWQ